MKTFLLVLSITLSVLSAHAQLKEEAIQQNFRLNFISPGVEYEMPFAKKSSVLLNLGIGVGGSYKDLSDDQSGYTLLLSPYYDLQIRNYYNFSKRIRKGKNVDYNSANFIGLRFLARGPEIAKSANFYRTTEFDFALAPTWGIQRSYGRIHLLFDLGPYVYFDMQDKYGFLPMFELNIGYNLSRKSHE